ncbi:2H-phosphodiest domain-containing protein [Noumeavirus]|uniref:2H-phosphodiest domain-containing protein n=1 Tax=Noumeavirus TaxID=1955558 RepID=UPI000982BEC2|nr:2H-phosphodiest domain-containing protein [Noumeavirus]AQM73174.1 2H-phosphodiest domain-containing protein [Noumeavirus]AQQ73705.1 hypothetical protein [Kurlavirus BKC-1]QZX43809.1 2H-phosphodiest domain-containing protein [Marseillevirus sp.]
MRTDSSLAKHNFLSNEMKKISNGVYQPFYGVTVISKVLNRNICSVEEHLWKSSLSSKFSPLPYESYHMTVFDLVVPENAQSDELFESFLRCNTNILKEISRECQKIPPFEALLKNIYWTRGTIGIEVEPLFDAQIRERISKKAGIKNKNYVFHVTLAYRFVDGAPSDEEIQSLAKIIRKVFPEGKMQLEAPDVYKFNSMREFILFK